MNDINFSNEVVKALDSQGRKHKWLADLLGISTTALRNKLHGRSSWTESEIYMIENELINKI